ncbi:hypothetical protein MATL_G00220900 [Megalops atlanticus]|uniref:Uncharacterized protein n=1 Tax=Megalops atlanticus TaxID=7932 RepID=A0A9D3PJ30_MEGAT|nr:hypothetical protein MATL_G00220900 [Megalops atlanticus]
MSQGSSEGLLQLMLRRAEPNLAVATPVARPGGGRPCWGGDGDGVGPGHGGEEASGCSDGLLPSADEAKRDGEQEVPPPDSEEEEEAETPGRNGKSGEWTPVPEDADSPVFIPRWERKRELPPPPLWGRLLSSAEQTPGTAQDTAESEQGYPGDTQAGLKLGLALGLGLGLGLALGLGLGLASEQDDGPESSPTEEEFLSLDQIPKWEQRRLLPLSILLQDQESDGPNVGSDLTPSQQSAEGPTGTAAADTIDCPNISETQACDDNVISPEVQKVSLDTCHPTPDRDRGTASPAEDPKRRGSARSSEQDSDSGTAAAIPIPEPLSTMCQGNSEIPGQDSAPVDLRDVPEAVEQDSEAGLLLPSETAAAEKTSTSQTGTKKKKTKVKGLTDGKVKKLAQRIKDRWRERRGIGGSHGEDGETEEESEREERESQATIWYVRHEPIKDGTCGDIPTKMEEGVVCQTSIKNQAPPPPEGSHVTSACGPIDLADETFTQEKGSSMPKRHSATPMETANQSQTGGDSETQQSQNDDHSEKINAEDSQLEDRESKASQSGFCAPEDSQWVCRNVEPDNSMEANRARISPQEVHVTSHLLNRRSDEIYDSLEAYMAPDADQSRGSKLEAPPLDFSCVESGGLLDSSALIGRARLSRTREHRPPGRRRGRGGGGAEEEGVGFWIFRDSIEEAVEDLREKEPGKEGRWAGVYRIPRTGIHTAPPSSPPSSPPPFSPSVPYFLLFPAGRGSKLPPFPESKLRKTSSSPTRGRPDNSSAEPSHPRRTMTSKMKTKRKK